MGMDQLWNSVKIPDECPPLEPLTEEKLETGDLIEINEWFECVGMGGFIDYDGHGDLATAEGASDFTVCPSMITKKGLKLPAWATHILWYNR